MVNQDVKPLTPDGRSRRRRTNNRAVTFESATIKGLKRLPEETGTWQRTKEARKQSRRFQEIMPPPGDDGAFGQSIVEDTDIVSAKRHWRTVGAED
jgi:hypothetical protein